MGIEVTITEINSIIEEQIQEYLETNKESLIKNLIIIDEELKNDSTNPVQNQAIYTEIQELKDNINSLQNKLVEIEESLDDIIL